MALFGAVSDFCLGRIDFFGRDGAAIFMRRTDGERRLDPFGRFQFANLGMELRHFLDFLICVHKIAKLAAEKEHAAALFAFDRSQELVVCVHGRIERISEASYVTLRDDEFVVDTAAQFMNCLRTLGNVHLLPAEFDGSQQGDERGGRGHDHVVLSAKLNQ